MKNARVSYWGPRDTLHMGLISLLKGKEIVTRLDNFLPGEREKYRDSLLVIGMDNRLINVGKDVPQMNALAAIDAHPSIDDNHTGFCVVPPDGYVVVDTGPVLIIEKKKEVVQDEDTVILPAPNEPIEITEPEVPARPEKVKKGKKKKHKEVVVDSVFESLAEGL